MKITGQRVFDWVMGTCACVLMTAFTAFAVFWAVRTIMGFWP